MSRQENLKGRLTKVDRGKKTVEELAEEICLANGYEKDVDTESWTSTLRIEGYREYYLYEEEIYKVIIENNAKTCGIFEAHKTGSDIEFVLSYYNGGCSFDDAIGNALSKLEKTSPSFEETKPKLETLVDRLKSLSNASEARFIYPDLEEHALEVIQHFEAIIDADNG